LGSEWEEEICRSQLVSQSICEYHHEIEANDCNKAHGEREAATAGRSRAQRQTPHIALSKEAGEEALLMAKRVVSKAKR
jgi:hypothetical protein